MAGEIVCRVLLCLLPHRLRHYHGAQTKIVNLDQSDARGVVLALESLVVVIPPAIATQPIDRTVSAGKTAKFSVTATGTTPLTYQWRKNGVNISGATKSSYITPPTVSGDNGSLFSTVVTNIAGSVTSNPATLTVK